MTINASSAQVKNPSPDTRELYCQGRKFIAGIMLAIFLPLLLGVSLSKNEFIVKHAREIIGIAALLVAVTLMFSQKLLAPVKVMSIHKEGILVFSYFPIGNPISLVWDNIVSIGVVEKTVEGKWMSGLYYEIKFIPAAAKPQLNQDQFQKIFVPIQNADFKVEETLAQMRTNLKKKIEKNV